MTRRDFFRFLAVPAGLGWPAAAAAAASVLDVRAFGARGDGRHDDTAAFQAAITAARGQDMDGASFAAPVVLIPRGFYRVHELDWNGECSLIGEEAETTVLCYNGAGGRGSYLIRLVKRRGAVPFAGFSSMTLDGWNRQDGTAAENAYFQTGGGGVDWGFKQENLHYVNTLGDAVRIDGGIVNLHLDRLRWDNVGGWGLAVTGHPGQENRPVSLTRFTLDNRLKPGFAALARRFGAFDGQGWGGGVVRIGPHAAGIGLRAADGRIELNDAPRPEAGIAAWFLLERQADGNAAALSLANVKGFFPRQRPGVVGYAPLGGVDAAGTDVGGGFAYALFLDATRPEGAIPAHGRAFVYFANRQQDQGPRINGVPLEMRAAPPGEQTVALYPPGAVVFNAGTPQEGGPAGWINIQAAGAGEGMARVFATGITLAPSSPRLRLPAEALRHMTPGRALRFTAADGSVFVATVRRVEAAAETVELAQAPERALTGCTVTNVPPHWRPFGMIGAAPASFVPDSTAADLPRLVEDLNRLLAHLRQAGLMRPQSIKGKDKE